jgi:hypothetical protein
MKASAVIRRCYDTWKDAELTQWLSEMAQFKATLTPRDTVAFGRSNDQSTCLKKQGPTKNSKANQQFDDTTETST